MSDERLRLVAELQNKASAELKKLQRDMGGVKPSAGMAQAKTWFTQLSSASETANKSLRPLSSGLGMIGAGGLAAGLSIAGLARQFTDLAKALPQLKELSRQTGMSATEIERLKAAAGDLNVDPSKMQASLSSFSRMMVDFHKRHGDLYEEMANHDAAGLAEKIRREDPGAAYRDVLKWLDAIPEAQRRAGKSAADAVQIQRHWAGEAFGDEDMAQLLSKGMKGFEDAYAQAARDVHEITAETIAAAEKFDRSIASFERTWKDFETTVGPTVFDNLRHATDDFREVFDEIKGAADWFDKVKDHPVQAAGEAAESWVDAQAKHNREHPEGIIVDVPGLVSKAIHALTDATSSPTVVPDSRPMILRAPVPKPTALQPPTASAFHPDDDRATRARASDADGWKQQEDIRQGVLQRFGSLDKPVTHLVGTLKTASAAVGDDGFRPAAFHPAALGAGMATMDPEATIAAGTKAGVLAALRELQGESGEGDGGTLGGFSAAAAGVPSLRYGRGAGGGYRATPGSAAAGGGDGGTRSWRNNNPGNISMGKFASAHGADGSDGRFAHFPNYAAGRKAQEDLWFNSDTYRGLTLAQAVGKWSPTSENDTAGIVKNYAAAIGLDPNTPLAQFTPEQRVKLLDAQQAREGWRAGTRQNGILSTSAIKAAEVKDDTPEVAAARKYLAQTATGAAAQRADSISKMNPAFALKAAEAIRQARAAGLTGAGVFSGYRTPGQTGSAYDRARMSGHSYGVAADFSGVGSPGSPESRAFDAITSRLGLGGYGPDNPREFNHKELFGSHLEKLPSILARLQATLGPDGAMVNPAETWAAAGVPVPKGASPSFPEVVKALPPELAKRTLGAFLGGLGGKPGRPMGMPDTPAAEGDAAHPVQVRTLAAYIRATRSMAAKGEMPHPRDRGPAFHEVERLDTAHQRLAAAMRAGASGQPIKVDVTDASAAKLGVHVGKQFPSWMSPGADGPIQTRDMRDARFAPKVAPLPAIAPEPLRPDAGSERRADDGDESHLHVHLHQDGRVRSVRSGSGLKLHLDTGRTLTQFA